MTVDLFVPSFTSTEALGASFCLGGLLHTIWFRVGEWDLWIPGLLATFGIIYAVLVYFFVFFVFRTDNVLQGVLDATKLFSLFLLGLFTSMGLYRTLFHPLRRFPGPFLASVSSLYITTRSVRSLHAYKEVQQLHETYGDVVRLGPSELSISSAAAQQAIHSAQSPCVKGPWYHLLLPMVSLHTSRDKAEHAHRRKVWDRAFSSKSLREYEPRVAHYTKLLLSQIEARAGKPMDASLWCNFYGFDVMGDLAFGKSFDMLKDGTQHPYMVQMHDNTIFSTMLGRFPWVASLAQKIPVVNNTYKNFHKWLAEQVKRRMENEPELADVFSWVLEAYRSASRPSMQDTLDLQGDANLIVVAGSDTTSSTLTCLLFELALHPHVVKSLHKEVDEFYSKNERPEHLALSKLPYLQAVVNESLRLHPPVPSGVQRLTPPEGLHIGETFIPGNTIVQVPPYALCRDRRIFPSPNEFIPERWTSRPDMVKDASAFAPFSMGHYSCVGKQLALMEIRYVISQIVFKYDIKFAPGQTKAEFLHGMIDGFTLVCPKLDVVFTPR